ncbi:hypothetical protein B5X24_HaOG200926 [Helicoverpa armigera]|nr:hypothetical protein B5X24_HaOG200926 [Helicoverpa armigera]
MFVGHTVLDLKYFAYLYFFFGLNQKSLHSIGPRISTLYSIILTTFIMYCVIFRFAKISVLSRYLTGIEYFVNVLVSLLTGDEYINQYWINAYTIDSSSVAKKQLKKLKVFAIVGLIYTVIYRVNSCYVFCQTTPPTCESFELVIVIFIHIANDLRRISILLNIVLLYFRSKVMRMALNSLDIKDTNRNSFAVNKLIQMYETLVDSLKYIGFPFKVTVCIIIYL